MYFLAKKYLIKFMESVHEGKKPFECDHSVSQKGDLKVHINSVHEEMKPFKNVKILVM